MHGWPPYRIGREFSAKPPESNAFVRTSIEDGVQIIHIARPEKKNALTTAMYASLVAAMRDGSVRDDVRVHLFHGEPGAFSAGNDIVDFLAAAPGATLSREGVSFLKALATADKPMVAAVDGLAIGIGTTMLLHCDLVYASPRSVFRTPFLDLGLVPEAGSSLLAPRLMGHVRAFELLCLGEAFDAGRAEAAGIITRIVPETEVIPAALAAAKALARKPREALAIARRLVATGGSASREDLLARIDAEAALFAERLASAEARAAFAAFLERKKGSLATRLLNGFLALRALMLLASVGALAGSIVMYWVGANFVLAAVGLTHPEGGDTSHLPAVLVLGRRDGFRFAAVLTIFAYGIAVAFVSRMREEQT
eukprot:gene21542-22434_t